LNGNGTRGIPHHGFSRRNVTCDDTAGPDDRIIADTYAWQEDRAAADPDIAADLDRSP
jgi:hypothetical protein